MTATFVEHQLPNGLRIICETMPRVRSAAVAFHVKTGSRHESEREHGVSHFLEHMCFKGTARRGSQDINIRFDELGSIYNAFTGKEHTVYYGCVAAERLSEQLELLADMMRPSLPPDDFETERKVILEEIAMSDDSFERHLYAFLHETLFPGHPLGHEILGEKAAIEQLSRETMLAYHQRRYAPENLTLLASGALEPEAVFAAAGRLCADWPRAPEPPTPAVPAEGRCPPGVHTLPLDRFKRQALVLLYPSVAHGHADSESIEAFVALFGGPNSRCYWNIVQQGVATHAGAVWLSYADCGYLALYADGEPQRCEEMLAALRAQAEEVTRGGFDDDEVLRVKNRRRTNLALESESPRTRLMQVVDDLEGFQRPRTAQERLAAVEAVTSASIAEHLRRYPITGPGMLLSVGPRAWPEHAAG